MSLNIMIKKFRTDLGISQIEMANSLGYEKGYVSEIENGKKTPSFSYLLTLVDKYNVDLNWLIKGDEKGNPNGNLIGNPTQKVHQIGYPKDALPVIKEPLTPAYPAKFRAIPVVNDYYAYCSALPGPADPTFDHDAETVHVPNLAPGTYRAFVAHGESMQPTISPGDLLVCRHLQNVSELKNSHLYIIVTKEDGIVCKRILQRTNTLILQSDNPDKQGYPSYPLAKQNILQMWQVHRRITANLSGPDTLYSRIDRLEAAIYAIQQQLPPSNK